MDLIAWMLVLLVCLLAVVVGLCLASLLSGEHCVVSIQRRRTNHELTNAREKEKEKLSSRIRRAFSSSAKPKQPERPIEDVHTTEFRLKLAGHHEDNAVVEESSVVVTSEVPNNEARREERRKEREKYRKKYGL